MKKILFLVMSIVLGNFFSYATTTFTVGTTGTHPTILSAYNDCINPDKYIIEILDSYDYSTAGENGGITLLALPSKDATNTVTIRLASGVSKSFSTSATSMFTLQGADWVIFDGRAGGIGNTSAWTMINSSSSAGQRVFLLKNGATNDTIRYCTIKGDNSHTGTNGGLILFSTATLGDPSGNSYNTVENCVFREYVSNPAILIVSIGGGNPKQNQENIISNCHFVNYTCSALYIGTNSQAYTVSDNHFYQTTALTPSSSTLKTIHFTPGYGGHIITGNYIGGQGPSCSGGAYTLNSSSYAFYGIWLSSISLVDPPNVIENNVIANLNLTSTAAANGVIPIFCGIYTTGSANFIIGSSGKGNTIGSTTGIGNIVLNYSGISTTDPVFSGIHLASEGTHSVSYNTIGAITYSSTVTNGTDQFALVRVFNNTTATIDNNTFGNATANNISTTSNTGLIAGIYSDTTYKPTLTIDNNTFQNFTVSDVSGGTDAKLYGIYLNGTATAALSISNNSLKTFTYSVANPTDNGSGPDYSGASVFGIWLTGTTAGTSSKEIYGNKIIDFKSTYTGSNIIHVLGIASASTFGGTFNIYRNKIRGLSSASSNSDSGVLGIYLSDSDGNASLSSMVYNNIVLLTDGANTVSKTLVGIYDFNYASSTEIYHNTVKLSAAYSSGTGSSSAYFKLPVGVTSKIKNNIFQNLTTGGSGIHYAQTWSTDYVNISNIQHNYNESPNASKLIYWGGSDESLAVWNAETNASGTELSGGITISSTTGVTSSNAIVGGAGTPIGSVTTDYDLNARDATHPWIGAYESIIPLPIELLTMSAKCQKSKTSNNEYGATVKWITASEKNSDYFIVEKSINGFDWVKLDTIDGSGTKYDPTNYYYHDDFINPTPENETVVYYRVSQTDFDGVVNTYDILSCKCEASDKIKIHPVPSTDFIVINFGDQNNVPNSFQITDMFGKIIQDVTVVGDKANNTSYKLDISNYSSGRYIIKINDWKMKEDAVFIKK